MKNFKPFYKNGKMSRLLFEQEEEDLFASEDEPADEPDEEPADEPDAEDAEETPDEDQDTETDEEVPEDAKMKLGKIIDDDLEAILVDFETQARQSKKMEKEGQVEESISLFVAVVQV